MTEEDGRSDDASAREGSTEDVETWPPEDRAQRSPPGPASPDHEQARQGTREPVDREHHGGSDDRSRRMSDADATNWAAGAHLASLIGLVGIPSILGPLVVWLVKRDDHPFVADQARESLNFQISVLIYTVVGVLAAIIFAVATLGVGLFVVVPAAILFLLGVFLLPIYAAIKASDGTRYRYPLTMRLISASRQTEPRR